MNSTSASLLERLCAEPDAAAWERFVQLYTPLLFYWTLSSGLARHDAEDLVQDVFEVLLRKLPEFQYDASKGFRNWLRTITMNKWRDSQRRAAKRIQAKSIDDMGECDWELPELTEQEYRQGLTDRALQLVAPEFTSTTWTAFRKTAIEGLDPAEVATELGISRNAVYVARSRVLGRLRKELAGLLD
ncbi:MAG: sigma-70 family RNA polymerase sigma factor [Planctomycetales bacterium]|nr:sigma-70 family RNA polymerase sigma factor [Planctomycetales bacterium]